MGRIQGTLPFSSNFEPQIKGELDARKMVDTKEDLWNPETWKAIDEQDYSYKGMTVSVKAGGIYQLIDDDATTEENWSPVHGNFIVTRIENSLLATTSPAVTRASNNTIAQIESQASIAQPLNTQATVAVRPQTSNPRISVKQLTNTQIPTSTNQQSSDARRVIEQLSSKTYNKKDSQWQFTGTQFNSVIETNLDEAFNFKEVKDNYDNIFIRIPTLYKKIDSNNPDNFTISKEKIDKTYLPYPCFLDENKNILPYIDIGKYKGSGCRLLESRPKKQLRSNRTISKFREMTHYSSPEYKYQQLDAWIMQLLLDLLETIFNTRNCEQYMGTDWKGFYKKLTGDTDILTNPKLEFPSSCCGKVGGDGGFKFFGIEDIVGYSLEFVDGIGFSGKFILCQTDPNNYESPSYSNAIPIEYLRANDSGFISKLGYSEDNPFLRYPKEVVEEKTDTNYGYCEYDPLGTVVAFGAYEYNSTQGPFYKKGDLKEESRTQFIGARLCRRPIIK